MNKVMTQLSSNFDQWRILFGGSGLEEGYTIWHCTTPVNVTFVSGFTTGIDGDCMVTNKIRCFHSREYSCCGSMGCDAMCGTNILEGHVASRQKSSISLSCFLH
jgi:hypothetical protein